MRYISEKKVVEEVETHILFSVNFFFLNHNFCEILWENTVEPGRAQITLWRLRILC